MITVSVKRNGRTLPAPLPVAPCAHRGPDAGPAGWHVCDHPNPLDDPLIPAGDVVCGTGCNGKCTTRCPGYAATPPPKSYPEIATRHLLYHVYPRRGSQWRTRLLRLRERIGLFNGVRAVAVAVDGTTDDPHHVERELDGCGCEIFSAPNDPNLREVATFDALFARVAHLKDPSHATFYGHAKGSTRAAGTTCHRWTEVMEETLLGDWPAVAGSLSRHPVTGCFKKLGRSWPQESASEWHYSGSWHWFRNAELFSRDWRKIDRFWSGIEPYPSLHFTTGEAGCVFHEAPQERMNLYDAGYWNGVVEPEFARRPKPAPAPPPAAGLLVELGGGKFPRGGGWVNVDRDPAADVVLDLERDRLPWPDASVDALYSSHTLEHVLNLKHVLREIVRVCRAGAAVEFRLPHWNGEMALCHDHKQAIGDEQVHHWCESAVGYWFADSPRGLKLLKTERVPSAHFAEAKSLFPHLTDDQLMRFVPNACHESRYSFEVVQR